MRSRTRITSSPRNCVSDSVKQIFLTVGQCHSRLCFLFINCFIRWDAGRVPRFHNGWNSNSIKTEALRSKRRSNQDTDEFSCEQGQTSANGRVRGKCTRMKSALALIVFCAALRVTAAPAFTPEQALKLAIYTPMPVYPIAARVSHIGGDGTFILRISIRTGLVKDVQVERSTGEALLDSAATRALKKWRFKPGILPSIKVELPQRKDDFATEDSLIRVPVHFFMRR